MKNKALKTVKYYMGKPEISAEMPSFVQTVIFFKGLKNCRDSHHTRFLNKSASTDRWWNHKDGSFSTKWYVDGDSLHPRSYFLIYIKIIYFRSSYLPEPASQRRRMKGDGWWVGDREWVTAARGRGWDSEAAKGFTPILLVLLVPGSELTSSSIIWVIFSNPIFPTISDRCLCGSGDLHLQTKLSFQVQLEPCYDTLWQGSSL